MYNVNQYTIYKGIKSQTIHNKYQVNITPKSLSCQGETYKNDEMINLILINL